MMCIEMGCEGKAVARGWCRLHYGRWHRGKSIGGPKPTSTGGRYTSLQKRVWDRIDSSGGPERCWPWLGRIGNEFGYGGITIKGRRTFAHRLVRCLVDGISPEDASQDLVVRHSCHNPLCCNPSHLAWGTQADNIKDKVDAARQAIGASLFSTKLDLDQVREIRALLSAGVSQAKTAKKFGVCQNTISRIALRRTWKYVREIDEVAQ